MGFALAQMRLARDNGMAEDVVVNTFHFITPTPGNVTGDEAAGIATKILAFFNTTHAPQAQPVRNWLSTVLANNHEIRVYDLQDPKPRVPVHTQPAGITPHTGGLPSEVALCLSYQATPVSGLPQARRRGRIYIGPLSSNAASITDTADVRPDNMLRDVLLQSAVSALIGGDPALQWAVASQPTPNDITSLAAITRCWVDNSFDTQRRRGADATNKKFLPV